MAHFNYIVSLSKGIVLYMLPTLISQEEHLMDIPVMKRLAHIPHIILDDIYSSYFSSTSGRSVLQPVLKPLSSA